MAPRIAKSLAVLRSQVDAMSPGRAKDNDGWLGDARHQATKSEHNPDANGVVRALDITNDPAHGVNARAIAQRLLDSRDPRILYVISNAQICSSRVSPWVWRPYSGVNDHSHHFHLSVVESPALYDDTRPWKVGGTASVPPVPQPAPPSRSTQPGRFTNIVATEFGGAGDEQPSAYSDVGGGWPKRPGVALPFRFTGKRPTVRVAKGNKSVACPIVDVGPWNTNDPYWQRGGRPQAETGTDTRGRKTNKAGIDLTPATMDALLVPGKPGTRSTNVDWEFADAAAPAQPPRAPTPAPPTPTKEPQMDITKLVPLGWRGYELFRKIQQEVRSGPSIVQLLQKFAPEVIGFVQDLVALVGAVTFSHLPEEAQASGFDRPQVLWIQTSVNALKLADPPIEVDGYYGTKTKAAVAAFQTAHGLTADGWAGKVTLAAMQQELNKLTAPAAPPAAPAAA